MSQNIYNTKHEIIKCTNSQTFPQRLYPGRGWYSHYAKTDLISSIFFLFFIQPCYAITHKYTQTHVQHSCRSSPPKDKNSCTRNEAGHVGISAQLQLDVQPPPQPFTFSLNVPQKASNLSG